MKRESLVWTRPMPGIYTCAAYGYEIRGKQGGPWRILRDGNFFDGGIRSLNHTKAICFKDRERRFPTGGERGPQ